MGAWMPLSGALPRAVALACPHCSTSRPHPACAHTRRAAGWAHRSCGPRDSACAGARRRPPSSASTPGWGCWWSCERRRPPTLTLQTPPPAPAAGGAGAASGGGGGGGGGAAATGYAHISNVADTRVERLDKARRAATGCAQGSRA